MFFTPAPHYVVPTTMIDVVKHLGLADGLKLCLDAGDANSYTSGQKWLDLSGNGYDFFRGTSDSAQGSDPTFNGTAGGQSSEEYWSFDGGDFFEYDTSNEAWMNNIHKNNAKVSFAYWAYLPSTQVDFLGILGTSGNLSSNVGFVSQINRNNEYAAFAVNDAGGLPNPLSITTANGTITFDAWNFVGFSLDEDAGQYFFQVNDTQETGAGTYNGSSSSNATYKLMIGGNGGPGSANVRHLVNGSRVHSVSMWEGVALTADNLSELYEATRGKFGH